MDHGVETVMVADEASRYRPPSTTKASRLIVLSGATAGLCVVAVGAIVWARHGTVSAGVFSSVWTGWRESVWEPWFGIFIVALWALQWRYPARREERALSNGLAQDLAWFLLSPILAVTFISAYLVVLSAGVTTILGDRTLNLVPSLGIWRVAVLAFVVSDFMAWYTHWLHHRVPALWQFHSVHHSQREMNVLSDNRQHVIETIVSATVAFLPAWALGLNTGAASTLAIATVYISAFIHTNIRTNLGPLRFVLVSPQAHRVHHSIEPQHYDTNFGTVFTWWDYLLGTHYPGDHEYPPTGISDTGFPMERSASPARIVRTWGAQTLYPFRILVARDYAQPISGGGDV